ncbi:MAG TPA: bifunctional methylenetetrahydrofolate dehydrogenase/methenyltetrahydrofolate cyclohydrolase FolD [Caulobacteraceae bacterium]|nr:bifunctional methylenetetrahydrofolate dehydrogenase/methenyltetrahydrofolate cyclohydrolase FolD [Caulobacteraceae bacterium]
MAEAQRIEGAPIAERLVARVREGVAELKRTRGVTPGLAVILVGDDPASQIYVASKGEQSRAAGMQSVTRRLPAETSQEALLAEVQALNADPAIHGILVQSPAPPHIDELAVQGAVDPEKDVDGLTVVNIGRLASGRPGLFPATPVGCIMLLESALGALRGRRAVVVGRSNLVGKPIAQLLLRADCTVTVCHSKTVDLPAITREADILVAAVGQQELIRGDWIKPGAAVIDVGIHRILSRMPKARAAGKMVIVGDVAYREAAQVAGWITPVPGGVGPMTVACLLANTLTAARRAAGLAD